LPRSKSELLRKYKLHGSIACAQTESTSSHWEDDRKPVLKASSRIDSTRVDSWSDSMDLQTAVQASSQKRLSHRHGVSGQISLESSLFSSARKTGLWWTEEEGIARTMVAVVSFLYGLYENMY